MNITFHRAGGEGESRKWGGGGEREGGGGKESEEDGCIPAQHARVAC